MNWFTVGDEVYLREDSMWNNGEKSNPLGTVGVISRVAPDATYEIDWSNGEFNTCYIDRDLYQKKEDLKPKQESIYDKVPKDILVPFKHSVVLDSIHEYLYVGDKFIDRDGYIYLTSYNSDLRVGDLPQFDVSTIKEINWDDTTSLNNLEGETIWTREKYEKYSFEKSTINKMKAEIEKLQKRIKELEEELV